MTSINLPPGYTSVEQALCELYMRAGVNISQGPSKGMGWSQIERAQRCLYLVYMHSLTTDSLAKSQGAKAEGTIIHAMLANRYLKKQGNRGLERGEITDGLLNLGCDPKSVTTADRVVAAYERIYGEEAFFEVLAVELDIVDPVSRNSCKLDLLVKAKDNAPAPWWPGVWIIEHKSSSRFSAALNDHLMNHGEIIGQQLLYKDHLESVFGSLNGTMINLLGKQKVPRFERFTYVASERALHGHRRDVAHVKLQIEQAKLTGFWPRSRASCVGQFGICERYTDCIADL